MVREFIWWMMRVVDVCESLSAENFSPTKVKHWMDQAGTYDTPRIHAPRRNNKIYSSLSFHHRFRKRSTSQSILITCTMSGSFWMPRRQNPTLEKGHRHHENSLTIGLARRPSLIISALSLSESEIVFFSNNSQHFSLSVVYISCLRCQYVRHSNDYEFFFSMWVDSLLNSSRFTTKVSSFLIDCPSPECV